MNREEIIDLIENKELTVSQLLDVVIEYNGIIGVGLVTLGEELKKYCTDKINTCINYE